MLIRNVFSLIQFLIITVAIYMFRTQSTAHSTKSQTQKFIKKDKQSYMWLYMSDRLAQTKRLARLGHTYNVKIEIFSNTDSNFHFLIIHL